MRTSGFGTALQGIGTQAGKPIPCTQFRPLPAAGRPIGSALGVPLHLSQPVLLTGPAKIRSQPRSQPGPATLPCRLPFRSLRRRSARPRADTALTVPRRFKPHEPTGALGPAPSPPIGLYCERLPRLHFDRFLFSWPAPEAGGSPGFGAWTGKRPSPAAFQREPGMVAECPGRPDAEGRTFIPRLRARYLSFRRGGLSVQSTSWNVSTFLESGRLQAGWRQEGSRRSWSLDPDPASVTQPIYASLTRGFPVKARTGMEASPRPTGSDQTECWVSSPTDVTTLKLTSLLERPLAVFCGMLLSTPFRLTLKKKKKKFLYVPEEGSLVFWELLRMRPRKEKRVEVPTI